MLSGHRSAWRRRGNSRAARIAVPLAIPMALGLTLGIILAVSSGGKATTIEQSALGDCASAAASASGAAPRRAGARRHQPGRQRRGPCGQRERAGPAASGSAPAPAGSAAAAPCPSASGSAAASGAPAAAVAAAVTGIPPLNPAGRPGLAGANAVDAAGNAFSFTQTQAEAANSTNCTVSVPARPLTAQGLASPWVLGDGCTWANGGTEGVFIDATILAPNGQVQVYNPLVITQGTRRRRRPRRRRSRGVRRSSSASATTATRWRWSAGARGRGTASTPSGTRWSTRPRSATRPTSTGWPTSRSPAAC